MAGKHTFLFTIAFFLEKVTTYLKSCDFWKRPLFDLTGEFDK